MPNRTSAFYVKKKKILNYCDRLDRVQSVLNTRQDNDVIIRTSAIYTENDTELL